MRYKQLLSEQQLDELRMNPKSLKKFSASAESEGILAGFEAELVFSGLGGQDEELDYEPDYDADERAYSIGQVVEFFENDDYGMGLGPRGADRLRNDLDERYYEWYDEQVFRDFENEASDLVREEYLRDFEVNEKIEEYLRDTIDLSDEEVDAAMAAGGKRYNTSSEQEEAKKNEAYANYIQAADAIEEELDELVEKSMNQQDEYWDSALESFRDAYQVDDSEFFNDIGLRYMSSIADEFGLDWPIMMGGGNDSGNEYDYDNASTLAKDLEDAMGVKTKVAHGYHSATRKKGTEWTEWIFEPDSSLDASDGDMPVEIISPPMPLQEALTKMREFFSWAKSNGAYANSSTGFHMSLSLPFRGGNVDYTKLALFLGDEHVLQEFGRQSNYFTKSALKLIKEKIKGNPAKVNDAMELMKNNLLELAHRAVAKTSTGKYESINMKDGYIEFRSAGGYDYFEDLDKLQNTLMRYAQAIAIAGNPAAERKEYYKKLYKLVSPEKSDPALDLFAKFTAGEITAEQLKKEWAEKTLAKEMPAEDKSTWQLYHADSHQPVTGGQFGNMSKEDAWERAKRDISPGSSMEGFKRAYVLADQTTNIGKWDIVEIGTDELLGTIDTPTRGEARDIATEKYENIDWYIRPHVEFDQAPTPPPKLSRRAELAKRIKTSKTKQQPNFVVYNKGTTADVEGMSFYADNLEQAVQDARELLQKRDLDPSLFGVRPIANRGAEPESQSWRDQSAQQIRNAAPRQDFEIFDSSTGNVVHRMPNATAEEVRATLASYESPSGGYAAGVLRVRNPQPQQQQQEQVRMPNGVPVWELYDVSTNNVVHVIADHTENNARSQATGWLSSIGAEDPSTYLDRFAIRPKMLQPGERNQSSTINESWLTAWDDIVTEMASPANRRLI